MKLILIDPKTHTYAAKHAKGVLYFSYYNRKHGKRVLIADRIKNNKVDGVFAWLNIKGNKMFLTGDTYRLEGMNDVLFELSDELDKM